MQKRENTFFLRNVRVPRASVTDRLVSDRLRANLQSPSVSPVGTNNSERIIAL